MYSRVRASRLKFKAPLKVLLARKPLRRDYGNEPELKYNDIAAATYQGDNTGTITALNLIAVGDDNTSRDGRQICNRSIHVQGYLAPVDSTTLNSMCRMMLVWDSQPNGAIATMTDILSVSNAVSSTNLNNRERFRILRDLKFALGSSSNTATQAVSDGSNTYLIDCFLKLKDIKTTYSGTTAVIASVATGALLLVTIGSNSSSNQGTFTLTTRLRFTDR